MDPFKYLLEQEKQKSMEFFMNVRRNIKMKTVI